MCLSKPQLRASVIGRTGIAERDEESWGKKREERRKESAALKTDKHDRTVVLRRNESISGAPQGGSEDGDNLDVSLSE